jgi:predicted short-subunit dehydrogenase-like oxidoreductase (DUF2520 family)
MGEQTSTRKRFSNIFLMNPTKNLTAVLLGAGNVGTHLGQALDAAGVKWLQVFSRTPENAGTLARKLKAEPITDVARANVNADLWLISVRDEAMAPLIAGLPSFNGLVAHTSGSVSREVLARFPSHGVFYPFQTFSKSVELKSAEFPMLVEGSDPETTQSLLSLAGAISGNVKEATSKSRASLHLAAVFSCNFVNHLYALSSQLLEDQLLSFELLRPLIEETTRKALSMPPRLAQTGPAVRNDRAIVSRHLEMLAENPPLQEIYRHLSESILSLYGHTGDQ